MAAPSDFSARFMRVSRLFKSETERRLRKHGVHAGQEFVLACLWEEDGLAPGELARRIGVEAGTVTRALRRMTASGLVRRDRDDRDARRVRVWLTERGKALRTVVPDVTRRIEADAVARLSTRELATLVALLERVHDALTEARPKTG